MLYIIGITILLSLGCEVTACEPGTDSGPVEQVTNAKRHRIRRKIKRRIVKSNHVAPVPITDKNDNNQSRKETLPAEPDTTKLMTTLILLQNATSPDPIHNSSNTVSCDSASSHHSSSSHVSSCTDQQTYHRHDTTHHSCYSAPSDYSASHYSFSSHSTFGDHGGFGSHHGGFGDCGSFSNPTF